MMAIKTSTFGRLELSGQDAVRFLRHLSEDKPKQEAKKTLQRGREALKQQVNQTKESN
jgi:hypothetical protein